MRNILKALFTETPNIVIQGTIFRAGMSYGPGGDALMMVVLNGNPTVFKVYSHVDYSGSVEAVGLSEPGDSVTLSYCANESGVHMNSVRSFTNHTLSQKLQQMAEAKTA